jgi:ferredoxin, 2Fe-2S
MPTIRFRLRDGSVRSVDAEEGDSLMRIAVDNDISDIEGECGGEISCATCHVYLPAEVLDQLPPVSRDESELLEVMDSYRGNSRLGCQVRTSPVLDDVEVVVAPPED